MKLSKRIVIALLTGLVLVGALATYFSSNRFIATLDQGISYDRPTVRSELRRGVDSTSGCVGRTDAAFFLCVTEVQSTNVQKNMATEPFRAGVAFAAWFDLVRRLNGPPGASYDAVARASRHQDEVFAQGYFDEVKDFQRKNTLKDQQVCDAAFNQCETVLKWMQEWEAKRPK